MSSSEVWFFSERTLFFLAIGHFFFRDLAAHRCLFSWLQMRVGVLVVALLVVFAVMDAARCVCCLSPDLFLPRHVTHCCLLLIWLVRSVGVPKARHLFRARNVQAGLDAARAKNEARLAPLRANKASTYFRDRFGSEPYLKLHNANEQVKGTVVVFHGFSGMPVQQNPLVDYLYNQGFDVFDASVAGHYRVNAPGPEVSFPGSDKLKAAGLSPLTNTFVAWPYPDYGRDPIADYTEEVIKGSLPLPFLYPSPLPPLHLPLEA
jgi:hypothetical protein